MLRLLALGTNITYGSANHWTDSYEVIISKEPIIPFGTALENWYFPSKNPWYFTSSALSTTVFYPKACFSTASVRLDFRMHCYIRLPVIRHFYICCFTWSLQLSSERQASQDTERFHDLPQVISWRRAEWELNPGDPKQSFFTAWGVSDGLLRFFTCRKVFCGPTLK